MAKKRKRKAAERWEPFEAADYPPGHEAMLTEGSKGSPKQWIGTFLNNLYQVEMASHNTVFGEVLWLAIVRRDRTATHDWRHLQRIKNELCGPERDAVELYPAESRLVDTNNQYHLFVFPEGASFPVGYAERDVSDQVDGTKHKQRPFEQRPDGLNARGPESLGIAVYGIPPGGEDE